MERPHWNRLCPWQVLSLKPEHSFKCFTESRPKFLALFSLIAVTEWRQGDYFIEGSFACVSAALTESSATILVLLKFFGEEKEPNTENWSLIFGNTPEEEILNPSSRAVINPNSWAGVLSSGGGCACHLSKAVLLWARFSVEKSTLGISWCCSSCQQVQDGHKSGELCAEAQMSCKSLPRSWGDPYMSWHSSSAGATGFKPSWMGQHQLHSQESSGEVCQLEILPHSHTKIQERSKGIKGDKQ